MAQLRLIAPAVALAGLLVFGPACGRGDAAPSPAIAPPSGLAPPKGWQAATEIAAAAVAGAAGSNAATVVVSSDAWAEPARGCYAVWLALRGGPGPIDAAADQLIAGVQRDVPGVTIHDVAKPAPGAERGALSLAFAKAPYRGTLRAQLAATGEVAALACMWNEREPKACEAGCAALFGSTP